MNPISRRNLFRALLGRGIETNAPVEDESQSATSVSNEAPPIALILDRFCLAYQGSFCSVCSERCPVPGAITTEMGKPRVNPDLCNGCTICQDVCPAPRKAVFLVPRKPRPGMISQHSEPIAS